MAEELARSRLGRGLAALLGEADEEPVVERARGQRKVPIEFLRRNPRNPRSQFHEPELDDLAASIRERGIIQPIVVRPVPNLPDAYEIIAGERRWRAAQRAGLHDVPVVIVEADDKTALELAIIENVQRSDLNVLDEAAGYEKLIAEHGYTQADLGSVLGKSRSHVANTLRLLKLPASVREIVARGDITAGHARALLAVRNPEAVARTIVEQGLNVRDVERIAKAEAEAADAPAEASRRQPRSPDADTRALELALQDALGLVVKIDNRGTSGELRIKYRSLEQLDALCQRLKAQPAEADRAREPRAKRA
ncbi:ParB/RepB/Spo0J family partition protein [Enterovirga aerilata]|uniref:ParB/RepB/Spo0J family partition protein n=1 Tax=Enterovirga aerilata TaxID=2730920 RepID=A0A849ICJ0_9HYPH|nr:ParB/RepB/Spo0J family partition protein [Enterovirga sp. DB1703]NNM73697.1 ParB/RepB/Spo0J family partition protein [Enterovirga sp. DB1703]